MATRTLQEETRRKKNPRTEEVVEWTGYRVSIPKGLVEGLGWGKGTKLAFTITGAGRVEVKEVK